MALPQQVVEQLSQGSHRTSGWSLGILFFSGGVLFVVVLIYAGLRFGYEPYLNSQVSSLNAQAQKVEQSVSPADEANLITFYSQITNIRLLIKNHIFFSRFLTWLEENTEANVYYTSMASTANGQVSLTGIGKTSADTLEQIAAFEASPDILSVAISNVGFSSTLNGWAFNVSLAMEPSLFLWTSGAAAPAMPAAQTTTTTAPVATTTFSGLASSTMLLTTPVVPTTTPTEPAAPAVNTTTP
jgi:hypothetical protein